MAKNVSSAHLDIIPKLQNQSCFFKGRIQVETTDGQMNIDDILKIVSRCNFGYVTSLF